MVSSKSTSWRKVAIGFTFLVVNVVAKASFREIQVLKELERFNQDTSTGAAGGNANDRLSFTMTAAKPFVVPATYAQSVELPVDHFGNKNKNTFKNRYWVADQYYEPGGPVFAFDTGEADDGSAYLGYMTRETSFFNQYLREFKGLGIVWEHRYYGESTPYPINLNTTAKQMQYLTTEQALKDFDVFANQFQWANHSDVNFSPKKTPWVHVGGSYPGMRAAMLRNLYPKTVYASYAASAPVQAQVDMSAYWEQVYRGMNAYEYGNCTKSITTALNYIDSQLDHPKSAAAIKQKFLGRSAEKNSNEGFADTLFYPLYNWQSAGVDETLSGFCDYLQPYEKKGGEALAGRWASWPMQASMVNDYNFQGDSFCEGPVKNETMTPNCLLDERFEGVLSISWTWQYCTEWGFFQASPKNSHSLGSKYNTLQHQQEICYRQFPDGLSSGYLPKSPKTDYINSITGGWKQRPSNVFWTEGEFDPWRTLSTLSSEPFAPGFKVTNKVSDCKESTSKNEVFGYLVDDAQHCYDFRSVTAFPGSATPVALFVKALKSWLKCFGK